MQIKRIHQISDIAAPSLNKLADMAYPFLRHEFLSALEKSGAVCQATGWTPQHLLMSDDHQLIGFMPLYLKTHSQGEYVFDQQWAHVYQQCGLSYYPKWLTAIPFTPCQGQRILMAEDADKQEVIHQIIIYLKQNAVADGVSSWHCLFPAIAQTEILASQGLSIREDVQFHWYNRGYRDFQDYLQSFSSKKRKAIKRERLKIQQQGLKLERISGANVSTRQWELFFQFYCMTYLKRGLSPYLKLAFFLQLAESMADNLLLVFARKDEKYVAAALSIIGDDTLYGRYWGCFDEYNGLHFETCYYQGIEFCLERKLACFDSGAQGEHKISRGFEPVSTYSAHWISNPEFARTIDYFLQQERQNVQHYKRAAAAYLPFKKDQSYAYADK